MIHIWHKGQIFEGKSFRVAANELSILRGYAVFDYFRTYNTKPFRWDMYWKRFQHSALSMEIEIPYPEKEIYLAVEQLIKNCGFPECSIRFILTGGLAEDGISSSQSELYIYSEIVPVNSPEKYEKGMAIKSMEYLRDFPEVKSTDYKFFLSKKPMLQKEGFDDVLYVHQNMISEMSRSNIFMIKKEQIYTPKNNILRGITRATVMDLALKYAPVIEQDISLEMLLGADEIFTTSSTKGVMAITKIDEHVFENGSMTKTLKKDFDHYCSQN